MADQPQPAPRPPLNNPWADTTPAPPPRQALNNPWAAEAPRLNNPWADTAEPTAKPERPGLLTRSLIETATGQGAATGYDKLLPALKSVLPKSMQGTYVTELAGEISKAGPEMVDFITSPAGIALTAAHFVPATAPFAAATDVILGGHQALQAIPDTIDALRNLGDPHKVGRALVDVLGAYAGLKGGAKVGRALREIPAETARGVPMAKAYADAFRRTTPPPVDTRGAELRAKFEDAAGDPAAIQDLIKTAETPTSVRGKVEQTLYRHPLTRAITNVLAPRVKQPPILDLGQDLVNERAGAIDRESNRARRVADWIQRNVPEDEQHITKMGYAMEGDLPEMSLSSKGREGLEKIRQLNRDRDEMLRVAYGDNVKLMDTEHYIRHYWDFEDPSTPTEKFIVSSKLMRDSSLRNPRQIGSLKLGMTPVDQGGFGLKPKYENVTDVVRRRHMEAVQAVENQKFANKLRDYGLIIDPTKANMRNSKWAQAAEAPALKRAVYAGEGKSGEIMMSEKAPLVHPDIAMAVNAIFNEPFKGPLVNAANQLTAFSKALAVGFSMFHNNALSEVSQAEALAAGGRNAIPRAIRALAWPLDPEFRKGITNSIWEVRGKVAPEAPPDVRLRREAIEPWLEAGGSFQSSESEAAAIKAAMNLWSNSNPVLKALGAPVRAIGKTQYVFNRALFDYFLPGQWLHSAEHLFASEMNRLGPNASPEAVMGLRREIADHVNRAYGSDNMQRLLLTPKAQQALKLTLFAPMWTLSNMRVLAKGYETTTGARLTNRYIAGAALTYFLTSQLANYAMSEWASKHGDKGGEYWDEAAQQFKRGGHWTWQNPGDPVKVGQVPFMAKGKYVPGGSDNMANIYIGQNPDGSARYIRLGKAYREPFMWLSHPLDTLGSKLSLPLRQLMVQFTNNEPGGFPAINSELTPEQQNEQRAAHLGEMLVPFSARPIAQTIERAADPQVFKEQTGSNQILGLPSRKGASYFQAIQDVREARDANRMDLAEQVLRNAELNGISRKSIMFGLRKRLNSQQRTEMGRPKTEPPPRPELKNPWE